MDEWLRERILLAASLIPPGRVASYGDLGRLAGAGPRQVAAVVSRHGSEVPWWRVTNAAGEFPAEVLRAALPAWAGEGIALKPNGRGCRMATHRADPARLRADFDAATAPDPATRT